MSTAELYLDTNIILDFYRTGVTPLHFFDQLHRISGHLVLTEQIICEFHRNRIAVLNEQIKLFDSRVKAETMDISLLMARSEYSELKDLRDRFNQQAKDLQQYLISLRDAKNDPIATQLDQLANDPSVRVLAMTKEQFERAYQRKLLGNPPTSPKRDTIGDEVNWEIILDNVRANLIIVSKDGTYRDNMPLLEKEFRARTGHNIVMITDILSQAIKALGETPLPHLVDSELKASSEQVRSECIVTDYRCPRCGHQYLDGIRYHASPSDMYVMLDCQRCGHIEWHNHTDSR